MTAPRLAIRQTGRCCRLRLRLLLVCVIAGVTPGADLCAADFPDRPVKVVVPFAPGGESDTFVRIVQKVVRQHSLLEQPLVVINVPGAGGTIGSRRVKDSEADGYTILNLHDGILSAKLTGQTSYGPDAFEPIAATGRSDSMVCVRTDSKWTNLTQLLQAARDQPETIRFGANLGALSHFGALQLEQALPGAAFRYVPAGGGAKRFADLLGDHIDVSVFNVGEYVHFKDGGLRALAILHTDRHPDFPEVPTALEQGLNVVRNSMQYWWAPKKTPPDRVARLVRMLREAMATEQMQQQLAELKMEPVFLTGPELRHTLRQRELVMKGVRMDTSIELPDTPFLAIVVTTLLGLLTIVRRRTAGLVKVSIGKDLRLLQAGVATTDESTSGRQLLQTGGRRAVVTLLVLMVFCGMFSSGRLPFWLISFGFVTLLGGILLERNRRNMLILLLTAVITGPGCYLLFTKVLTIDLP